MYNLLGFSSTGYWFKKAVCLLFFLYQTVVGICLMIWELQLSFILPNSGLFEWTMENSAEVLGRFSLFLSFILVHCQGSNPNFKTRIIFYHA